MYTYIYIYIYIYLCVYIYCSWCLPCAFSTIVCCSYVETLGEHTGRGGGGGVLLVLIYISVSLVLFVFAEACCCYIYIYIYMCRSLLLNDISGIQEGGGDVQDEQWSQEESRSIGGIPCHSFTKRKRHWIPGNTNNDVGFLKI